MERREGSSKFIALHGSTSEDTERTCAQAETVQATVVRFSHLKGMDAEQAFPLLKSFIC